MKHAGRINKKLTMAILLALTLGTSLPVYAEQMEYIKDKTLTQGDWELEEKLLMENSTVTANKVSLDGSSVPADNDPVMLYRSTLEGKKASRFPTLQFNPQTRITMQRALNYKAPLWQLRLFPSAESLPAKTIRQILSSAYTRNRWKIMALAKWSRTI